MKTFLYIYVLLFITFGCVPWTWDMEGHYLPKIGRERIYFQERLIYHGLNFDIAVIYEDKNGMYFFRDGKRCKF